MSDYLQPTFHLLSVGKIVGAVTVHKDRIDAWNELYPVTNGVITIRNLASAGSYLTMLPLDNLKYISWEEVD